MYLGEKRLDLQTPLQARQRSSDGSQPMGQPFHGRLDLSSNGLTLIKLHPEPMRLSGFP